MDQQTPSVFILAQVVRFNMQRFFVGVRSVVPRVPLFAAVRCHVV